MYQQLWAVCFLSACAAGTVKPDQQAADTATHNDAPAGDPGARLDVHGCTLTVERDNGPDGIVDQRSEWVWLDRTDDEGNAYVTDHTAWDSSSGTTTSRSVSYDDHFCVTLSQALTSGADTTVGTRSTSTCTAEGLPADTQHAEYVDGEWDEVSTVGRSYTYNTDGQLVETIVITDFVDPAEADTEERTVYSYDGALLARAEFYSGDPEALNHWVEYMYDDQGNEVGRFSFLGDAHEGLAGVRYGAVLTDYDEHGNPLVRVNRYPGSPPDRTEWTRDPHGRVLSVDRDYASTSTNTRTEATWDPDVYRRLTSTHNDGNNGINSYVATHTYSGGFPWTETIDGIAPDGGTDFQTVLTYTCPDARL